MAPLLDLLKRQCPPEPQRAITAAGEEGVAMVGEGEAPNPTLVPGENSHFLVNLRVPKPDGVIHAAAGQRAAIRREGQGVGRPSMPNQLAARPFPAEVPEKDRSLLVGEGQHVPIGCKDHVMKEADFLRLRAARDDAARGDIPHQHGLVRAPRRQQLPIGRHRHGADRECAAPAGNVPELGSARYVS